MLRPNYSVEEVTAHVLSFASKLAVEAAEGGRAMETVITIPSDATFNQRRAMLASAQIAKLARPQLLHETTAAALQRSMDLRLTGVNGTENESIVLFYNMGARRSEACVVRYRGAKHQKKDTVSMTVLGCGTTDNLGGHLVDMKLAEKMLAAFQAKHKGLADGITKSVRALKKLEKEAMGCKHVLSANKESQFRVESLFEDTDFTQQVTREDLEEWCSDIFNEFHLPVVDALATANLTGADLDEVEMIGGGWRIPKVQTLLGDYLQTLRPEGQPALKLSQHVNGDEAMATGAAFFGANSTASFKVKRIYLTDISRHKYTLRLEALNTTQAHPEGWVKNLELYPSGTKLKSKKSVKTTVAFDIRATVFEDDNHIISWDVSGIHEASTGPFANHSSPVVSLKFELDSSGVVQLQTAAAIFEEEYVVQERPKRKALANASSNETGNLSANASASKSSEGDAEQQSDHEAEADDKDGPADDQETDAGEKGDDANAETDAGDKDSKEAADNDSLADAGNETAVQNESSEREKDAALVNVTKVRKMKRVLLAQERFDGVLPRPLSPQEIASAVARLDQADADDEEVRRVEAAKNELESYIYESRDKITDDENHLKVSSQEQRQAVTEALTQMEEWLWEDEASTANASVFYEKLRDLEQVVLPIRARAAELEARAGLPETIEKLKAWANSTLTYVKVNMTWVDSKEIESVNNLTEDFDDWWANVSEEQSKRDLTEEPAFSVREAHTKLRLIQSEAQRLTKIRKIEPVKQDPYAGYGGYGAYNTYWEEAMKNFSARNGTNWTDAFGNNFSNYSEYLRSFYEHANKNFSGAPNFTAPSGDAKAADNSAPTPEDLAAGNTAKPSPDGHTSRGPAGAEDAAADGAAANQAEKSPEAEMENSPEAERLDL